MTRTLKTYIGSVMAGGAIVLAMALLNWTMTDARLFFILMVLAGVASVIKLRLPGMTGTYSFNFLLALIGVAYFTLPETVVAGCAAAVLGSVCFTKRRPTMVQILFNMANLVLSIAACFFVAHSVLAAGFQSYRYAVLAAVACVYFVINTVIVSGVLFLLEGKPLRVVCREWYVWSFPYYLVGAVLVGMLPSAGRSISPEAIMILMPLLYIIHFFYGLSIRGGPGTVSQEPEEENGSAFPQAANVYLAVVIAAGLTLSAFAASQWAMQEMARFAGYFALAVVGSMLKVRLPRMVGTISVAFVVLLAAVVELPFYQVIVLSAVMGVVQTVWKAKVRPLPVQVFFNSAALVLASGLACLVCAADLGMQSAAALTVRLALGTAVLYFTNTMIVSTALCLLNSRPLNGIWQNCYFWSFPYYLVGAAAAGMMAATSQNAGWLPSMLVLPAMGLVYVSYEVHITRATQNIGPPEPAH